MQSTRDSLGRFTKGNTPYMSGRSHSQMTRDKISHTKQGISSWNKGLTIAIDMMCPCGKPFRSYAHRPRKYCSRPCFAKAPAWNKGRPVSEKERVRLAKIRLIGVKKQQDSKEPTSIEKKLYMELARRGLLFETQKIINGKFIVDAYIPSLNLIIEADGNYWHSLDRVVKKDRAENAYLTKCGYNLLRFSEAEINSGDFKERLGGN